MKTFVEYLTESIASEKAHRLGLKHMGFGNWGNGSNVTHREEGNDIVPIQKSKAKRRVKMNVWGNYKGYLGTTQVEDFGLDDVAAGYWLETGIVDHDAGYSNPKKYRQLANDGKEST